MLKCIDDSYRKFPIEKEMQEYNCKTLMSNDLKKEINWMKDLIDSIGNPVVFTHNDFRSSNLMITEPNDELVVCDFESAGYGYRGNDFNDLMSGAETHLISNQLKDCLPKTQSLGH